MKHTRFKKSKLFLIALPALMSLVTAALIYNRATALSAAEICKQKTIFGFVGTKSCVGQDDEQGNVPTVSDLTSVENLPSMPAVFSTAAPTNPAVDYSKICNDKALLGTPGTANCTARTAMNHLDKGNTPSTLTENFATSAPTGRLVPMNKDDDGESRANITKFDRTGLKVCGTVATTLALKIADCLAQNSTKSRWLGAQGNAGQGNWTLVQARSGTASDGTACGTCNEIWRDDRTGLLWSDRLSNTEKWCKASGSNTGTICADLANQPSTPDSLCAEGGNPIRVVDAVYDAAKGNLLAASGTIKVRWWLPTRADWMQAEENGIRFVLPNIADNYWTATADSGVQTRAWIFVNASSAGGGFDTLDMLDATTSTRCIGQPIP